jgi:Ca2+/Na+ antiporter
MMIGIGEIFVGIIVIVLAYIGYALIKQLRTLEKTQARRILDLMVIGSILFWLDIIFPQEFSGEIKIQATAGMLIFLYGYWLLILEKYREGRRDAKS